MDSLHYWLRCRSGQGRQTDHTWFFNRLHILLRTISVFFCHHTRTLAMDPASSLARGPDARVPIVYAPPAKPSCSRSLLASGVIFLTRKGSLELEMHLFVFTCVKHLC